MRLTLPALGLLLVAAATAPALAVQPTDGYFTAHDGVKIHYLEAGNKNGPGAPVVLIHGYTGTALGNWFTNGIADALDRAALGRRHRLSRTRTERQAARSGEVRPADGRRRRRADGPPQDREGAHRRLLDGRLHHRPAARDTPRTLRDGGLRRLGRSRSRGGVEGQSTDRQARTGSERGRGAENARLPSRTRIARRSPPSVNIPGSRASERRST